MKKIMELLLDRWFRAVCEKKEEACKKIPVE
jgi:hypothetical protein